MRLLILFLFLFAIDYYAFQGFRLAIQVWPKGIKTSMVLAYVAFSLLAYGILVVRMGTSLMHAPSSWVTYAQAFMFILFFSKFILGIFVGLDDFRRLITWVVGQWNPSSGMDGSRSVFLSRLGLFASAVPLFTLMYGMWRNPHRYRIHRHEVSLPQLPDHSGKIRVVQISDIHSGTFFLKEPLENAIDMINQLNADIVVFTGDLVNYAAAEMAPYIDVFKQIKSKYGVYSVLGNHDYGDYKQWPNREAKVQNFQDLLTTHQRLGWELLRNENRLLNIEGVNLAIIGVENSSASPRFHNYGNLPVAAAGTEVADARILLSHDPSHWNAEVTSRFPTIDLTLSGHTHGFQFGIEIPGWIKWSPSKYVYRQWAGLYREGNQYLYVNRGFGMLGYPGRVGILPEITCIDLLKA